jgi:hypothetical protein
MRPGFSMPTTCVISLPLCPKSSTSPYVARLYKPYRELNNLFATLTCLRTTSIRDSIQLDQFCIISLSSCRRFHHWTCRKSIPSLQSALVHSALTDFAIHAQFQETASSQNCWTSHSIMGDGTKIHVVMSIS